MGNLHIAATFIILANVLMWFATISMIDINPAGSFCYSLEGSIIKDSISQSDIYANSSVLSNDIMEQLPSAQTSDVEAGTSTIFTDIFNNVLSWFKSAPGVKYVYGVIAAPYNILKCTGLPVAFIVGIGTFWYMISFLVLLAFLWGRD